MAPFQSSIPVRGRPEWPMRLMLVAGVVAVLYLGKEILAPLALALLLTIAAVPIVSWLERRRVPRIVAVLTVLLLVVGIMGSAVYVVVTQALALAADLPQHETTLRQKLLGLTQNSGPIDGLMKLGERLQAALSPPQRAGGQTVTIAAESAAPLAALFGFLHLVVAPLATIAITLLLMAFLLIQREDMRDRVLRLAGTHELHRTTKAMVEGTDRVGKFLLMQVLVNAAFGLGMGLGLWALGLPNAPLWGVLCFALRFIPFLGAPLSVLFPLVIAFATTPGWTMVWMVIGLFLVVDVLITYVMEPMLYGHSIGVTPLALIVSSAFWAVLWGPIGLILAPAMTAVIVVLGRHVPGFVFLDVLLGDSTPLPDEARFYQRLLAGDADGAGAVLDRQAAEDSLAQALRRLAFPAIAQVEADRRSEGFGPALALRAARTLLRVLEERGEEEESGRVSVLPVAGALDHAAAAALAITLAEAGHAVSTSPSARVDLAVLVLASGTTRSRYLRAVRQARASAGRVMVLAVTDEAEQSAAAVQAGPWVTEIDAVLTEAAPLLPPAEEAEAEPDEAAPDEAPGAKERPAAA
jgi:predicted PurR-regulated permease PerM